MKAKNYRYQFVAGNLALDFVNTVAYRLDREKAQDHLRSVDELRRWAAAASLPGGTWDQGGVRRVRALRDQFFAVFHAIAIGRPAPARALLRITDALHNCQRKRRLSVRGTDVRWTWGRDARCSDHLLYPILVAATELVTSGSRGLVRQCAGEGCGWLFLDRSNSRKRRWCSMADCGNRHKVREHYQRKASYAG